MVKIINNPRMTKKIALFSILYNNKARKQLPLNKRYMNKVLYFCQD